MTDADLWAAWWVWMGVATVVVLIAATLLIVIWMTARGIHREALRALNAAGKIQTNTAPIWALATTNEVGGQLLVTVQHIEAAGGALAAALQPHARAN